MLCVALFGAACNHCPRKLQSRCALTRMYWSGLRHRAPDTRHASISCYEHFAMLRSNSAVDRTGQQRLADHLGRYAFKNVVALYFPLVKEKTWNFLLF